MANVLTNRESVLPPDPMPLNVLQIALMQAIQDNSNVEAYCQAQYGRAVTVRDYIDLDDLPPKEEYPLVALDVFGGNQGQAIKQYQRYVSVYCAVYDERPETEMPYMTQQGWNIVRYATGLYCCKEFAALVFSAIAEAELSGGYVAEYDGTMDEGLVVPYYAHLAGLTIVRPL